MKASEKVTISRRILICPLADRNERGRIAYCFIRACIRKVRWLSMKDKVPSGRREFKPIEIPPATFEVGSSLRKLGEEVTRQNYRFRVDRLTKKLMGDLFNLPLRPFRLPRLGRRTVLRLWNPLWQSHRRFLES